MSHVTVHRLPLGNYQKHVGYAIAFLLRRVLPKGHTVLLRGRGPRSKQVLTWNGWITKRIGDRYSISLKQATRVGLYLLIPLPKQYGYVYASTPTLEPTPRSWRPTVAHPLIEQDARLREGNA